MREVIQDNKYVELTYRVIDQGSGEVLSSVDFPLGYVHGHNKVLAPDVLAELEGKSAGARLDVPIDCSELFGARDESLVFTDRIENVPEVYRKPGATIAMENESGKVRNFVVTRMDEKTLTVDGNNPLSGRKAIFSLAVLTVRDATEEEIAAGGAVTGRLDIDEWRTVPV